MVKIKRVWVVVAAAAVVVLIGLLALGSLVDADAYRGRIEAALSDALGRPVQLGHLSLSIFSGSLVATETSIADDPGFSKDPFLTAKDIKIGVELGPLLFHRELHIRDFTIDQPAITLVRAENGTWNYSSLGGEGKRKAPSTETNNILPNLTVGKIDIKGGTLTVGTLPANAQPRVYTDLKVSVQNFSFASEFPFTVSGKLPGGGSLDMSGNAGPINPRDASLSPLTAQVSLKHADLVAAGLVDPGAGISGVADLELKLVSNGQTAQADGTLHVAELKLAKKGSPSSRPVDVTFSVSQDVQALSGKIANANVHVGKAALTLTGTYQTRGNTTTTQMHVDGPSMPIDELEAFLPSLGVVLPAGSRLQGGTLTIAMDISGPVATPVVSGPVRVANAQLAGFDLGSKLSSIAALTGAKTGSATTIQTLSTDLHYGPEGTRTDNLNAVVTGLGSATGNGSVSPGGALNYHLVVKLSGPGGVATQAVGLLSGALGQVGGQAAQNGIPVTIGGTTSNPTFTPDMSKMAGGVLQKKGLPTKSSLGKTLGGLIGR